MLKCVDADKLLKAIEAQKDELDMAFLFCPSFARKKVQEGFDIAVGIINSVIEQEQEDSLALIKNVVSYLEDCKYKPVVMICEKLYRIDIPCHEDDFWKSQEYKKCVEILGDYYCQGIYSLNTYKLYVKRTKNEQKSYEPHNKFFRAESILAGGRDIPHDKYLRLKSLRPQPKHEWSEDGKKSFVDSGFLWCVSSFEDFKAGETYWLEYLSNDNYSVRSDNLLARTYHITPEQLYSHFMKYIEQKPYEPHNWPADKDNLTQEQKQEWSEGDSVILNEIIDFFENGTVRLHHHLSMYAQWLKSLPERFNLQPNQEWSEEDEKTISFVIDVLRANHPDGFFKTSPAGDIHVTGITVEKLIKKLESLLSRPKPSGNWKSSKYMLSLVKKVADGEMLTGVEQMAMGTLHEQLKKLSI